MSYYLCTKTQEPSFKFPLPSACSLTKMLGGNASTMNDNASTAKAVPPLIISFLKEKAPAHYSEVSDSATCEVFMVERV